MEKIITTSQKNKLDPHLSIHPFITSEIISTILNAIYTTQEQKNTKLTRMFNFKSP
jgi:hypothetical protein